MIDTCILHGCCSGRAPDSMYCASHNSHHTATQTATPRPKLSEITPPAPPVPASDPARHGRRAADIRDGESSGGDVDYYRVFIAEPKRPEVEPYMAECEDIIEHLNMTFAEGSAFKSIWRKAAQRTLGHMRRGSDFYGIRDSQKVEYYGKRMLVMSQREARKETADDVREHLTTELKK